MSKHTQGPWRKCGGSTPHYMAICDTNRRYIVFCMADESVDREPCGATIPAPGMDEQAANARLIVAASNSYDEHCGDRAVEMAERDLLGQALAFIKGIATYVEDGNVIELRECGFLQELNDFIEQLDQVTNEEAEDE